MTDVNAIELDAAVDAPGLGEPAPARAGGPRLRTSVPGPKSRRLLDRQRRFESNARVYPRQLPVALERGEGAYVHDVDGNAYIDFLMGAGALPLGHNHPEVVEAVERQLRLYCHGLDFPSPAKDLFIERLVSILPSELRDRAKIHFCGPTGVNAVDAAIKLCKIFTGGSDIVAFQGGFHGTTHSGMALAGYSAWKRSVPNLLPGVHFFPFPYAYRSPFGSTEEECAQGCLRYLASSLRDSHAGIPTPAALLLEVVQGEGGNIPAPDAFVQGVRRVTTELGVPMVVDEVQTGIGRTGSWFAFERSGVVPDVIVASKGLGGIGMPVSVIVYDERLDVWPPGTHTGTFRGNQLAFAAGAATIEILERDRVFDNVAVQERALMDGLRALQRSVDFIGDVRGRGLMIGVEVIDPCTGEPDGARAQQLQSAALGLGLLTEVGGRDGAVIRLLPPLNVDDATVDAALDILHEAAEPKRAKSDPGR